MGWWVFIYIYLSLPESVIQKCTGDLIFLFACRLLGQRVGDSEVNVEGRDDVLVVNLEPNVCGWVMGSKVCLFPSFSTMLYYNRLHP